MSYPIHYWVGSPTNINRSQSLRNTDTDLKMMHMDYCKFPSLSFFFSAPDTAQRTDIQASYVWIHLEPSDTKIGVRLLERGHGLQMSTEDLILRS